MGLYESAEPLQPYLRLSLYKPIWITMFVLFTCDTMSNLTEHAEKMSSQKYCKANENLTKVAGEHGMAMGRP